MKKFILIVVCLVSLTVSSFGVDGVIKYNSNTSDTVSGGHTVFAPIFDVDGTTKLTGSTFSVQLFYGAVGALDSQLVAFGSPISFQNAPFQGLFNGGNISIPGFAVGSQVQLQIRAWNNAGGSITTYDAATIRGASTSFTSLALGDPNTVSTYPSMFGLTSFQLSTAAVPEPTTIALGVIGGLGLLARRRRNA